MKKLGIMMLAGTMILGLGSVASANFTPKTEVSQNLSVTREAKTENFTKENFETKLAYKSELLENGLDREALRESREDLKNENFEARTSQKRGFLEDGVNREDLRESCGELSTKSFGKTQRTAK